MELCSYELHRIVQMKWTGSFGFFPPLPPPSSSFLVNFKINILCCGILRFHFISFYLLIYSTLFRLCNKKSTAWPEVSAGQYEHIKTSVLYSNLEDPGQLQTQAFQDDSLKYDPESDRAPGRNWWTNTSSQPQPDSFQPSVRYWDFSCIFFPDLGSYSGSACLPPPDPSLLPGALQVPECHMAHWYRKINLMEERQSKQKWQREQNQHQCNSNDGQGVCQCRNWVEYSELVEKKWSQQHNEMSTHLRELEIMPLARPEKCSSHCKCLRYCLKAAGGLKHNIFIKYSTLEF